MRFENVVLVVADTLRAKNLPSYEGPRETTEFLSEKKHVENYYSNSPWTVPAHATLFTGELPSEHGTTTQNTYFNSENFLIKQFARSGFKTIGLSENGLVRPELGFGKDFDCFGDPSNFYEGADSWNEIWRRDSEYSDRKEKLVHFGKLLSKNRDIKSLKAFIDYERKQVEEEKFNPTSSRASIDKALNFLSEDSETFLFLNLMPVHAPYTFGKEQKNRFLSEISENEIETVTNFDTLTEFLESDLQIKNLFEKREKAYNASIHYLDSLLENFYERAPEETLFVVIGDHGELIGEYEKHGQRLINHHFGTFKELVEVPLYIYGKDVAPELEIEGRLFDHVSLYDFLLRLAKDRELKLEGKDTIQAEYFGKSGFNKQMGLDIPEKYRGLFDRKSFSIIDNCHKVDFTSDGEFFWERESMTENEQVNQKEVSEKITEKGEILYTWRLEE